MLTLKDITLILFVECLVFQAQRIPGMILMESKTSANSFKQFNKRSAAGLEYSASRPEKDGGNCH